MMKEKFFLKLILLIWREFLTITETGQNKSLNKILIFSSNINRHKNQLISGLDALILEFQPMRYWDFLLVNFLF